MTMKNLRGAAAIVLLAGWTVDARTAAPDFGPNVLLFDPSTPDIQPRLDAIFAQQQRAQFSPNRYALLFKPGQYKLDVQIGYYMHPGRPRPAARRRSHRWRRPL
jgi:hypothetical protein